MVTQTVSRYSGAITAEGDVTLTAVDLKALRTADRVSFHHHDGRAYVRATKLIEGEPFETERQHEIIVSYSDVTDHGATYTSDDETARVWSCFAMTHSPQFDEEYRTVVDTLRVGDTLRFKWLRSNNNDHLRNVNYHCDQFYIQATRANGKRYSWLMESSIGPDDTARLVRRKY